MVEKEPQGSKAYENIHDVPARNVVFQSRSGEDSKATPAAPGETQILQFSFFQFQ